MGVSSSLQRLEEYVSSVFILCNRSEVKFLVVTVMLSKTNANRPSEVTCKTKVDYHEQAPHPKSIYIFYNSSQHISSSKTRSDLFTLPSPLRSTHRSTQPFQSSSIQSISIEFNCHTPIFYTLNKFIQSFSKLNQSDS